MGPFERGFRFIAMLYLGALVVWVHYYVPNPSSVLLLVALASGIAGGWNSFSLINQSILSIDLENVDSKSLIKLLGYVVVIGVALSSIATVVFNMTTSEAVTLFTVTAEALGFIGLSLVEITLFLGRRSIRSQSSLSSHSNTTRQAIAMSSVQRFRYMTQMLQTSPFQQESF